MSDSIGLDLSPEHLQSLKNRTICEQLSILGDDLSVPRVIDHVATFGARKDREIFVDFVLKEGFEIVSLPEPDDVRASFDVVFSRADAPSEIDSVVLPMLTEAQGLGGGYDGWNCKIAARLTY